MVFHWSRRDHVNVKGMAIDAVGEWEAQEKWIYQQGQNTVARRDSSFREQRKRKNLKKTSSVGNFAGSIAVYSPSELEGESL